MTSQSTETSVGGRSERLSSQAITTLFLPVAAVGAALALVPLWLGDSRLMMGLAIGGLLFTCYVIAFNVIFGSTGQLFLCVGALAGIGGYGAALLGDQLGFPIVVSVLLATLFAAITGGILSWIAVRRSLGIIFTGIVTLIFALSFENLLLGLGDITGGESGFFLETGSETFLRERIPPYYLFLGLVVLYLLVHGLLRRSHIGWAFRALRDDEVAAELTGVNVARYRIYGGLIGAGMLGLAAAVYAVNEGRISPTTFGFGEVDVIVLVMLAFGGIGTLFGPVLGAVVFTVLDELLIEFGQLRLVAYGVLIIVLFLWLPRGVIPTVRSLWLRIGRQESPGKPIPADPADGVLEAVPKEIQSSD
jgi:branched-chain amino acid transport system permease protein